jgi:hypothetical protein
MAAARPLPARYLDFKPGGIVRFLLISAGIRNKSIRDALLDVLGKPIGESSALCIATGSYTQPIQGPMRAWNFIWELVAR